MDHFDWRLIAALQKNSRLTNRELGDIISLSTSQCSRRRIALEKEGIIKGYSLHLNPKALGFNVLAFVQVTIKDHSAGSFERFRSLITSTSMIQEAYAVSGDADYMLKIISKDLESLSDFVTSRLLASDTIAHVKSYIGLKELKDMSPLPA